jgi:hypothetical protein
MYEVLAMIKQGSEFTADEMAGLLRDVGASANRKVTRSGTSFRIGAGDSEIHMNFSDAPHVLVESKEIAEQFGIPCESCVARYEMAGDDPEMELFNDYLLINERLEETGRFVLFDPQEGGLLFAE